jgi:hypothetical protein
MKPDKILIIDDRSTPTSYNPEDEINNLDEKYRSLIVLHKDKNTGNLWLEEQDDVQLTQDFSAYSFIFMHDSHNDPLMQIGLKLILIQKLSATSTVVLFSGGKKEYNRPPEAKTSSDIPGTSWYELKREQFFDNLSKFMESFGIFGEYRLNYLYDRYSAPKTDMKTILAGQIRDHLENSLSEAIHSKEFQELLKLSDYSDIEHIKTRLSQGSEDAFTSALDQLQK